MKCFRVTAAELLIFPYPGNNVTGKWHWWLLKKSQLNINIIVVPLLQQQSHELFSLYLLTYKNNTLLEELQDAGRVRRGDHLPPKKYIRNTSTCGTTPTEKPT